MYYVNMSNSAPASGKTVLMNRLRSSFSSTSQPGILPTQQLAPAASITPPVVVNDNGVQPPATVTTGSDPLAVLDQVLTDVEQNKVQPSSPVTAIAGQPGVTLPPADSSIVTGQAIMPSSTQEVVAPESILATPSTFEPKALPIVEPSISSTTGHTPSPPTVITEDLPAEGLVGQSLTAAINTNDSLNPANPTHSKKEVLETTTPDQSMVEEGRSVQVVETETTPEISPEVEAYLQKVEDQSQTQTQQIVIADDISKIPDPTKYPTKPVIVIPITPAVEKAARFKGPKFSIRWLVEWSKKIMKMFAGKVIYRLED